MTLNPCYFAGPEGRLSPGDRRIGMALGWGGEDAVLAWQDVEQAENQAQWRKGDIALALQPVYGGQTLEKFAQTVQVEYHQLQNYRRVSSAYEKSVRTDNLPWSHHQRIAARDDRLDWLARAVAAGPTWTVNRMLQPHYPRAKPQNRDGPGAVAPVTTGWGSPSFPPSPGPSPSIYPRR